MGSVFSPWYFDARRRGLSPDPLDHCAINVVLYSGRKRYWAFTEQPRSRVERTADGLRVGPSSLEWEGGVLAGRFDERRVPGLGRLRGTFRLVPRHLHGIPHRLDEQGRHVWWAIAPVARIEVDFDEPRLSFGGTGYHDSNTGERPLERDFAGWQWSRVDLSSGTAVLYDVRRLEGPSLHLSRFFGSDGSVGEVEAPETVALPRTFWRTPRAIRTEHGSIPRVVRTLEDSPFYARSLVETRIDGRDAAAMHESLQLTTFSRPWLQRMLPFRIRRER